MSALLWEVQVAAAERMLADSVLISRLDGDRVYDTEIPESQTRPHRYIVIAQSPGEGLAGTFGRGGKDSLLWFHIWDDGTQADGSRELGNRNPQEIVADLERLFNGQRIALDQWTMRLGELTMIRLGRDPEIAYMHGIMQYRILAGAPVAP